MKKEIISIRKDIEPGQKLNFKERLKDNGALVMVNVRFYPGVEGDLKVKPFILHKNNKAEDIVTYAEGSDSNISGDDDKFSFPVYVDFQYDDEFVCYVENQGAFPYTLVIDAIVEYVYEMEGNGVDY